jgi:acyl carrier protein
MSFHRANDGVRDRLRKFVLSSFPFRDSVSLDDDISLVESGFVDSTDMLNLVMFLERTYGIRVEPEEILPENLDSVNSILKFLRKKGAKVGV